jgi:hypothetical protein
VCVRVRDALFLPPTCVSCLLLLVLVLMLLLLLVLFPRASRHFLNQNSLLKAIEVRRCI